MAKRRKGIDVGLLIGDVLNEYADEIEREVGLSAYEVGGAVVQSLQTSPKTPKLTGDYARGWTWDQVTSSHGLVHVTIHNETEYRLTHLLEYGHVLKRGGRQYGNVRAFQHIQDARDLAEEKLMKKIEEKLK